MKLRPAPLKYVLPLLLVYSALLVTGMFHHEIFLEEAQQLTIARDSNSIGDVFKNMLYEGHVTLWNSMLFYVTHYISARPIAMQLFHLLVIISTAFVFVRYAPFNITVKALVLFGCYFLFVYAIISRNYALGLLLLFISCVLLANPEKNMIRLGTVVVLMSFTHLFYVFAATGILVYLFLCVRGRKDLYLHFAIFTALYLFGAISAVMQTLRVPADNVVSVAKGLSWLSPQHLAFGIIGFVRGFITIPAVRQQYFWDIQYIQHFPVWFNVILALTLFAISIAFIYKSKKALLFYLLPVAMLTAFFAMTGLAGSRYFGLYFMFFLAALWLAYYDGVIMFPAINDGIIRKWMPQAFIYTILFIQLCTGLFMYTADYRKPFSEAKNTINFLKENHLDNNPLVVDGYTAGPPLSAYLGRKVYYLDIDQFGSFAIWKKAYLPNPRKPISAELAASMYLKNIKKFILITNREYTPGVNPAYRFDKLSAFNGAIIKGEDFSVYRITRN
jgi:hypothetical protein